MAEPSTEPAGQVVQPTGRSGRAFVLVMAGVMVLLAVLLTLVSRSYSGGGGEPAGDGRPPVTAPADH